MGYASIRTSSGAWVSAVVIANPMGTILSLCGELYAAQALSAYGLTPVSYTHLRAHETS